MKKCKPDLSHVARRRILLIMVCLPGLFSCVRKEEAPSLPSPVAPPTENIRIIDSKPFDLLPADFEPRWYEFGPENPLSIKDAGASSLTPFEPWPLSRRIVGMEVHKGAMSMGVNRCGFILIAPARNQSSAVYRFFDIPHFDPYSISSVFSWKGSTRLLLSRDRFFSTADIPVPNPRVFALTIDGELVANEEPLAFSGFPAADGWDVEVAERTKDGRFVLRAIRSKTGGGIAYAETDSPDSSAVAITAAAFRLAQTPRRATEADPVLRRLLLSASGTLNAGDVLLVGTIVADRDFPESYLVSPNLESEPQALLSQPETDIRKAWAAVEGDWACLLFADGVCFIVDGLEKPLIGARFPVLPEGFVYSAIGITRELAVAAWEEQDEYSVGAAGFVVLDADTLLKP